MPLTVTMPQLGESVTEGTIARWLKQPGDAIAKYESIAEVITDKVNAEIPAPADGVMAEVIAPEGAVVPVGQPICSIETSVDASAPAASSAPLGVASAPAQAEASAPATPPAMSPPQTPQPELAANAPAPTAQPAPGTPEPGAGELAASAQRQGSDDGQPSPRQASAGQAAAGQASDGQAATGRASDGQSADGNGSAAGYHLTPAVRMLVREHAVDLRELTGSGLGGRITKKDVLEYVQRRDAGSVQGQVGASAPATPSAMSPTQMPQPALATPAAAAGPTVPTSSLVAASVTPGEGDTVVPLSQVRRSIAEHMVRSRQTSPHAYVMVEVDMSAVSRIRDREKAAFEQRHGVKLTFLPFVARAVIEALQRFPTLNASWSDAGIVLKREINLGIAVALEDNLIVPVVRNADRLSIIGLATTMADLGARARSNHLKLDEIQGGTFTLNNTGALGAVMTQAIINQPQAAILTMDMVVKRPVVVGDAIAIRPVMNLGLSFDHRINDGLPATRFITTVQQLLESLDPSGTLV
jgi:pyruvate/2-oxoglutarate dehydrogenase complex dihydrolipoamide acyltransferase (E2) component